MKDMGGGKVAAEALTIEPESSTNGKNGEKLQDITQEARSLRSIDDDSKKKKSVDINEGSLGKSLISNDDPLKLCKIISVDLIRLPDSIINKNTGNSTVKAKKKKKIPLWSRGVTKNYNERKRRRQRERELQAAKENTALPQSPESLEKFPNEVTKSNSIVNCEISDKSDVVVTEILSSENIVLSEKSAETDKNELQELDDSETICESTVEEEDELELIWSEPTVVVEAHSALQHKSDQINYPEISDEVEIHLATNIHEDPTNVSINALEISSKLSPVSAKSQNNKNRKISLRRIPSRCGSARIEPAKSRKRISISDKSDTENLSNHPVKKSKILNSVKDPEKSMQEKSTNELDKNADVSQEQVAVAEINRCNPKFVRRRTRFTTNNIFREPRVVLCRLENFQDPLVTKWRIKTTLESLDNVIITTCRSIPMVEAFAVEENFESGPSVADVPIANLVDLSEISDANKNIDRTQEKLTDALSIRETETEKFWEKTPLVCEEAEAASNGTESMNDDNDDEEIVSFLNNRRKNRRVIESSSSAESSSSDDTISSRSYLEQAFDHRTARKTPLLRSHVRAALAEGLTDATVQKESRKTPGLPVEKEPRTPSPRKKVTRGLDKIMSSESESSRDTMRLPPPSRRKNASRVVAEDWNSEEISSSTSTTCSYEEAPKPYENESETIPGFGHVDAGNNLSFVACGQSEETETLLVDDINSNDNLSLIDNENSSNAEEVLLARRKLTALKNAMVVLTRLEDLGDFTEESNGNEIEFRTVDGDFTFEGKSSPPPDPLEIINDDENQSRDNTTIHSLMDVDRVSHRESVTATPIGLNLDKRSQVTIDSGIEKTPGFEDGCLDSDGVDSDIEMPLVIADTVTESVTENVLTDANGNHRADVLRFQCSRCQRIYKHARSLKKHRDFHCNTHFSCNKCQKNFPTLVQVAVHRSSCSGRKHKKSNTPTDSSNSEDVIDSSKSNGATKKTPSKPSQKKTPAQKVEAKKIRSKSRPSIDNLICGVCSIDFPTRQALSEHIFKHNTEELQEAFRVAKAKSLEDSQTSNPVAGQQNSSVSEKSTSDVAPLEENIDNDLLQKSITEVARTVAIKVASNESLQAKAATVCLCHRDEQPARPDKTDLQIEMVLLCQHCSVVFRRRECFEVHYRKSPQCANDRARGRLPRLYCANCQSTLNNWAAMRRHLEVHASLNVDGTVRFVCNICRVVFVGFGALFYNHWSSHLKDSMFVASRHSFPRTSVQPIEEIPKLPIGASSDETYILVAEHVCCNCKKLFSTRRDLEVHVNTEKCGNTQDKPTDQKEHERGWYCDVCRVYFTGRNELNEHGKSEHSQCYLCVAAVSTNLTFTCTRCFAMRKTVKEIEDHWRNQSEHEKPLSLTEFMEKAGGMNDELAKAIRNSKELATQLLDHSLKESSSSTKNQQDFAVVIDIAEESLQENDRIPLNPARKSPDTRENTKIKNNEQSRSKRALEDPTVKIVPSGVSDTDTSGNLVIDEGLSSTANENPQNTVLDFFGTVTPDKSFGSNMLEKTGQSRTPGKTSTHPSLQAEKANDAKNSPVSTSKQNDEPPQNQKSPRTLTVIRNLSSPNPISNPKSPIQNMGSTKYPEAKKTARAIVDWLKSPSVPPEIIDIADEAIGGGEKLSPNSRTVAAEKTPRTDNKTALFVLKKPGAPNANSNPMTIDPSSKVPKIFDRSRSRDTRLFILDTSKLSFEEVRLQDITNSKRSPSEDAAGAPKSGFLRVKNLSELQAVKKHNCVICNAAFESLSSLQEHEQIHLHPSLGTETQYPKGMTAALVLPDNSTDVSQALKSHNCGICNAIFDSETLLQEHQQIHLQASLEKDIQYPTDITGALVLPENPTLTTTQQIPTVFATGNVVTQQLIGLNSGLGVLSSVPVPNVILNNETTGSWFTVTTQNQPMPPLAVINSSNSSLSGGGALVMRLGGQQTVNSTTSGIMTPAIATPNTTIAQTQEIITIQQQQQLQHYQSATMSGMNQTIPNNSSGQVGFHILPAAVVQPTTQLTVKQQYTNSSLRNSTTFNLPTSRPSINAPFTYNSDMPNRYFCNICTAFQCNNIGIMNSHVMKHYTGFNSSSTRQNSTQPGPVVPGTNPATSYHGTKNSSNTNVPQDQARNNPLMKNNTQGPVWMSSQLTATNQHPGSTVRHESNQYQSGTSMSHQNNSTGAYVRGGQLLYRCLVCKSAIYRSIRPIRDHIILVHGITDGRRIENIVQKIYLCTICQNGTVMYDSEDGLRRHIYATHSNGCFT